MLIARLIAETDECETRLAALADMVGERGGRVVSSGRLSAHADVAELAVEGSDLRGVLDALDAAELGDALVAPAPIMVPQLFVSDMDSTMIGQECIDELADYAGLKEHIAAITERAMQGEMDFESALRKRVALLAGLEEQAIADCLRDRIRPMPGAATLVATLGALGVRTVLVTGGFHHFADPVARQLGFAWVVGNRLATRGGKLTGELIGGIVDSRVKAEVLREEAAALGEGTVSAAAGDGANDIPMIEAATYGFAYRAKPKARAAANARIDRGDLTAVLKLLGIPGARWVDRG